MAVLQRTVRCGMQLSAEMAKGMAFSADFDLAKEYTQHAIPPLRYAVPEA